MTITETTETTEPTVRERPILFTGPMVRALLAGRKTQTRRVLKVQPEPFRARDAPGPFWWFRHSRFPAGRIQESAMSETVSPLCPYGRAGDRLWVRETFGLVPASAYGDAVPHRHNPGDPAEVAIFRADWERTWEPVKKPSIFMPRWASRLTLEITDVRVERVQDITPSDARREGATPPLRSEGAFVDAFHRLWDEINGRRAGCDWAADPWVFVLTFKNVEDMR